MIHMIQELFGQTLKIDDTDAPNAREVLSEPSGVDARPMSLVLMARGYNRTSGAVGRPDQSNPSLSGSPWATSRSPKRLSMRNLTPIRAMMNWHDTVRARRTGAAHGRRPIDQDASRHPCLRQFHQLGRARRASTGWRLLICWRGPPPPPPAPPPPARSTALLRR